MRQLLATSLAVLLTGAACSGSSDPVETSSSSIPATEESVADAPSEPASADPESGSASGDTPSVAQLEFVAATIDGGELVGSDYAGTDTVFWFWAPW
ncbi:MAG: hypothetical protein GY929_03635 [Actinomycetia bacterium]|nr:hypothetical protein [Actinomycetes bacterium]